MPNLFPTDYTSEIITEEDLAESGPIGYKSGVAFDNILGDFNRNGKNQLLECTGIESWQSWCINCIQTERYKHLAYDTDFGIELEAALRASSREEAESILTREITEALLADPYGRTHYVENIEYDWTKPDAVEVTATIHGINDVTIDITALITQNT